MSSTSSQDCRLRNGGRQGRFKLNAVLNRNGEAAIILKSKGRIKDIVLQYVICHKMIGGIGGIVRKLRKSAQIGIAILRLGGEHDIVLQPPFELYLSLIDCGSRQSQWG